MQLPWSLFVERVLFSKKISRCSFRLKSETQKLTWQLQKVLSVVVVGPNLD